MPLTSAEHFRCAERLLSQASFVTSPDDPTPKYSHATTALIISRAQVHADLAKSADRFVESDAASAMRRVVATHVHKALASPGRDVRDAARDLADDMEVAGFGVDAAVEHISRHVGHGPHRHRVDAVTYDLDHQYLDGPGTVWEHAGSWNGAGEPIMCTPDLSPALPQKALPELVRTRGPLRSVKATPYRSYDEGWGTGPTFDPDTKIYRAHGFPGRSFDLARPILDKDGNEWEWTGDFDRGEPWLRREVSATVTGITTTFGAVEVFDGPLRQAEASAPACDAA